ncbi:MAG TPA: hypothetical protein VIJ51_13050 [Solirubrobacteraceae bacterium]
MRFKLDDVLAADAMLLGRVTHTNQPSRMTLVRLQAARVRTLILTHHPAPRPASE